MSKPKHIKELESKPLETDIKIRKEVTALIKKRTPFIVLDLKNAKLLISRIILQLQLDEIEIVKAKAILHAINIYIQAYREADFESRISELEGRVNSHL